MSDDITSYFKEGMIDFLHNGSNWSDKVEDKCRVCGVEFGEDYPFILTRGEEIITLHYECSLREEFVVESKEQEIDGEVF